MSASIHVRTPLVTPAPLSAAFDKHIHYSLDYYIGNQFDRLENYSSAHHHLSNLLKLIGSIGKYIWHLSWVTLLPRPSGPVSMGFNAVGREESSCCFAPSARKEGPANTGASRQSDEAQGSLLAITWGASAPALAMGESFSDGLSFRGPQSTQGFWEQGFPLRNLKQEVSLPHRLPCLASWFYMRRRKMQQRH